MRGRVVSAAVLSVSGLVALTCGASPAAAAAASRANWQLNESASVTVMHDVSGHRLNGAIGAHVRRGVVVSGHTGYSWPLVSDGPADPVDPAHLVTVPDDALLDPGTGSYTLSVTLRFGANGANRNLVQKGQDGDTGGFFKMETGAGTVACQFTGDLGTARVATGVIAGTKLHTVVCSRTAAGLTISVDGKAAASTPTPSGNISNAAPLTLGGKSNCAAPTVKCDYFAGFMDRVIIS